MAMNLFIMKANKLRFSDFEVKRMKGGYAIPLKSPIAKMASDAVTNNNMPPLDPHRGII